jgi:hypothetical protein
MDNTTETTTTPGTTPLGARTTCNGGSVEQLVPKPTPTSTLLAAVRTLLARGPHPM